ncbi:hypothetical protein HG530_014864 [Fusarium avenaceum]|nr:hypothetical protein HG530_014864 [Fusarium avenaceum]
MENVQPDITESTPLLRPDTTGTSSDDTGNSKDGVNRWRSELQRHFARWSALYVCGLFILLVDVPNFMSEVPKLRMLELGLCRDYYTANDPSVIGRDGSVPEHLCKGREIQSALAKMRGILGMIEGIPGLILAIPYGVLADSKGRRLVTGLSLLGFVLRDLWAFAVLYFHKVFPVRAVYAAPAFLVLGGGSTVISPMMMAIIAAAVPEASRTRAFFWVQVVLLITELVAPPLGAVLMKGLGPYFAFLVAVPLEALAFVTALLLSIQAAGQILLFAVVLPHVNIWLLNRMKSSSATNLALAQVSVLFLAAGAFCMGLANSVPVFIIAFFGYTLGNGFSSALRSLMTTIVHPDHLSLLFTAIAVFEGISTIGASPLLGLSFSVGLDIGGIAISLPFFIAAMLYTLAAMLLLWGMSIDSGAPEA